MLWPNRLIELSWPSPLTQWSARKSTHQFPFTHVLPVLQAMNRARRILKPQSIVF